jgi:hypothetical protein
VEEAFMRDAGNANQKLALVSKVNRETILRIE